MSVGALVSIFANTTFFEMSAFYCFIVCSWNWIWNILEILLLWLLLLLRFIHSTANRLTILLYHPIVEVSTCVLEASSDIWSHLLVTICHTLTVWWELSLSTHHTWWFTWSITDLFRFSWSLVTILILNAFQRKCELLWS